MQAHAGDWLLGKLEKYELREPGHTLPTHHELTLNDEFFPFYQEASFIHHAHTHSETLVNSVYSTVTL